LIFNRQTDRPYGLIENSRENKRMTYPCLKPVGEYPEFCETCEEETEQVKLFNKNNPPSTQEEIEKFLKETTSKNEMTDLLLKMAWGNPELFKKAYWGYTRLRSEDCEDRKKMREVGEILWLCGGMPLMWASFYLCAWDLKACNCMAVKGHSRMIEYYWDEVGDWMA
jgi:hypothetical protein